MSTMGVGYHGLHSRVPVKIKVWILLTLMPQVYSFIHTVYP